MDIPWGPKRSDSDTARKHELECLRMETDCLNLAGAVESPVLKLHFTRMAKKYSDLAAWGVAAGYQGQALN